VHIYASSVVLSGWSSSKVGFLDPILVLKSPHITVINYGYILSNVSVICSVASVSGILRLVSEAVGGRYIFTTSSLLLFGSLIFVNRLYSFPATYSIFNLFFTYVAIPPLVLFALLYSTSV